ncbi:hypothetical protein G9A89_005659 [Geosiphon pyriformis]|nr:hypothetical protein G9A89_005659 [Geosiphon pyriformis]
MTSNNEKSKTVNLNPSFSVENEALESKLRPRKKVTAIGTIILTFKSLGVIYGDLATSPLYAYTGIFSEAPKDPRDVYGTLSLIIWSLTIVPLIKYVFIVIRADDNGEGGTFALYSLLTRYSGLAVRGEKHEDDLKIVNYDTVSIHSAKEKSDFIARNKFVQKVLLILVLAGASLVLSDGLLTPAISVISAVEGIEISVPKLSSAVVPISCLIIVLLFLGQRFGTDRVSIVFAPIIFLWMISIGCIGIWNISKHPQILKAYNPYYCFQYFTRKGTEGFNSLAGVVLAVTGVEAMYADMGHFNRRAIQLSFPCLVYPPLILVYMGQGARLVNEPELFTNVFWLTIPQQDVIYWFIFSLAIGATIIGSQALISASFTLLHQAMQLDFFPRVKIVYTSRQHQGQVYIPEINFFLMVVVLIIVVTFKESARLTSAFGVSVASVMFITTLLLSVVMYVVWRQHILVPITFLLFFGLVDGAFLISSLRKVKDGGWFTLVSGFILATIMFIWKWGTTLRIEYESKNKVRLENLFISQNFPVTSSNTLSPENIESDNDISKITQDNGHVIPETKTTEFIQSYPTISFVPTLQPQKLRLLGNNSKIHRVPGIGLFYQDAGFSIPLSFRHFVQHLSAVHETLVFISIRPVAVPFVGEEDRLVVRKISEFAGAYRAR